MKKILLGICLLFLNVNVWAFSSISCYGHDGSGQGNTLYLTPNSLYINGQSFQVAYFTSQEIRTVNFIDTHGDYVYNSIQPATRDMDVMLYQINAVTGQTLATTYMKCSISGAANIKDAKIFH